MLSAIDRTKRRGRGNPMSVEGEIAGPSAKIALKYFVRPGLARLRMALLGKKVVVAGPPGAGKSTFMDYMHYGVFDPEQDPEVTIRPREARNFQFTLGRNRALFASIKQALDMPGQPDPRWVAEEMFQDRPHALILILDATAPLYDENNPRSTVFWLHRFSRAADQASRGMRRNRLRTVVVALNKADKASDAQLQAQEAGCKEVLKEWRASVSGAPSPHVLKCVSVSTASGGDETRWIDAVLSDVAIGLRENSR